MILLCLSLGFVAATAWFFFAKLRPKRAEEIRRAFEQNVTPMVKASSHFLGMSPKKLSFVPTPTPDPTLSSENHRFSKRHSFFEDEEQEEPSPFLWSPSPIPIHATYREPTSDNKRKTSSTARHERDINLHVDGNENWRVNKKFHGRNDRTRDRHEKRGLPGTEDSMNLRQRKKRLLSNQLTPSGKRLNHGDKLRKPSQTKRARPKVAQAESRGEELREEQPKRLKHKSGIPKLGFKRKIIPSVGSPSIKGANPKKGRITPRPAPRRVEPSPRPPLPQRLPRLRRVPESGLQVPKTPKTRPSLGKASSVPVPKMHSRQSRSTLDQIKAQKTSTNVNRPKTPSVPPPSVPLTESGRVALDISDDEADEDRDERALDVDDSAYISDEEPGTGMMDEILSKSPAGKETKQEKSKLVANNSSSEVGDARNEKSNESASLFPSPFEEKSLFGNDQANKGSNSEGNVNESSSLFSFAGNKEEEKREDKGKEISSSDLFSSDNAFGSDNTFGGDKKFGSSDGGKVENGKGKASANTLFEFGGGSNSKDENSSGPSISLSDGAFQNDSFGSTDKKKAEKKRNKTPSSIFGFDGGESNAQNKDSDPFESSNNHKNSGIFTTSSDKSADHFGASGGNGSDPPFGISSQSSDPFKEGSLSNQTNKEFGTGGSAISSFTGNEGSSGSCDPFGAKPSDKKDNPFGGGSAGNDGSFGFDSKSNGFKSEPAGNDFVSSSGLSGFPSQGFMDSGGSVNKSTSGFGSSNNPFGSAGSSGNNGFATSGNSSDTFGGSSADKGGFSNSSSSGFGSDNGFGNSISGSGGFGNAAPSIGESFGSSGGSGSGFGGSSTDSVGGFGNQPSGNSSNQSNPFGSSGNSTQVSSNPFGSSSSDSLGGGGGGSNTTNPFGGGGSSFGQSGNSGFGNKGGGFSNNSGFGGNSGSGFGSGGSGVSGSGSGSGGFGGGGSFGGGGFQPGKNKSGRKYRTRRKKKNR